jgi:hypothetical protein
MTVISIKQEASFWRTAEEWIEIKLPAEFARTGWNRISVFIPPLAVTAIVVAFYHFNLSNIQPNFHVYDDVSSLQVLILFLLSLVILIFAALILKFFSSSVANMRAQIFEGGARIAVDEDGLFDSRISRQKIYWRDVRSVRINEYRGFKEVALLLNRGADIKVRRSRVDFLAFNVVCGRWFGRIALVDVNTFDIDSHIISRLIETLAKKA